MSQEEGNKKEKNKKKKAALALLSLQKRLQKACGTIDKVEDWHKLFKKYVRPIISEFEDILPDEAIKCLYRAEKLKDKTKEGIDKSCQLLRKDVKQILKKFPKGNIFQSIGVAGFILGAFLVGAVVAVANLKSVKIIVKNQGCQSIAPLPVKISFPGLRLFDKPIPDGDQGTIEMLAIPVVVDAQSKRRIAISVLGLPSQGGQIDENISITFNGKELTGSRTRINLGEDEIHEVVITCRQFKPGLF